jgi:hypothetical protein
LTLGGLLGYSSVKAEMERTDNYAAQLFIATRTATWGQFFEHLFPRKITFRGKFRGISWKNDFSKLFPRKNRFFPNIFGGKFSAEFSMEFSPEKNESAPGAYPTTFEFTATTPAL